ncbi:MAG: YIP1 family protein [Pyrinomonadaceae bacterium]
MNRLAGIVVAAAGLVAAILSITKIVPYLTQPGIVLILAGGLIIGLSFIDKPDAEDTERMPTGSTLGNIFFAPTEVFNNLRRHPRWLVAFLIMTSLSAIFSALFVYRLTPERIVNHSIDKTLEMSMIANNEQAKQQVEAGRADAIAQAKSPVAQAGQAAASFGMAIFGYTILAVIFFLFTLIMGGKMNFWQAFSVAVYAYFPISVLRSMIGSVLLFLKDPAEIHPILGQQSLVQDNLNFLVLPSENPVIYTVLGAFSILGFYWLWLNATGLKNAGEKVSGTAAWGSSIGVFLMLLLLSTAMAAIFPSFLS